MNAYVSALLQGEQGLTGCFNPKVTKLFPPVKGADEII